MVPGGPTSDSQPVSAGVVPSELQDRVATGPPASWVKLRGVDISQASSTSPAVLLYERQFRAGANEEYHRIVQRLETQQAMHEAGHWSVDFDPRNQRVVIHTLTIHRDGQAMDHARQENLRLLQRESQMEKLVIDGTITVVALLQDVRVGDVLDVSYTIHTTHLILKDRAWLVVIIPPQLDLRFFSLRLLFPRECPMRWKSSDPAFAPAINESGESVEWVWEKENVARFEFEPNTPSWFISGTWIQATDCGSWTDVSAGITSAWREEPDDPRLAQAAREIEAHCSTPRERACRAIELVQDGIRYFSMNVDLGGQIPAPPGVVLDRRFGDCKDKSFLLAHLLQKLGIDAQPALVNTFLCGTIQDWLPSPTVFNHAVVKFTVDGAVFWVDPSITLQGGTGLERLLPDYRLGLPLGGNGDAALEKIPHDAGSGDSYVIHEIFTLPGTEGPPATLSAGIVATGRHAEEWRRALAHSGTQELSKSRELFYKRFFPEAKLTGPLQFADDRPANKFKVNAALEIPQAGESKPGGKGRVFSYNSHLTQSVLAFSDHGARRAPLAITGPYSLEHRIEMHISHPVHGVMREIRRRGRAFDFVRETKNGPNKTMIRFVVKSNTDSISPADFGAHRKLVNELLPETCFTFKYSYGTVAPYRKSRVSALLSMRLLITALLLGVTALVVYSPSHPQFDPEKLDPIARAVIDKSNLDTAKRDLATQLADLTKRQQETNKSDTDAMRQLDKDLDAYNAAEARMRELEDKYRSEQSLLPPEFAYPEATPVALPQRFPTVAPAGVSTQPGG